MKNLMIVMLGILLFNVAVNAKEYAAGEMRGFIHPITKEVMCETAILKDHRLSWEEKQEILSGPEVKAQVIKK